MKKTYKLYASLAAGAATIELVLKATGVLDLQGIPDVLLVFGLLYFSLNVAYSFGTDTKK